MEKARGFGRIIPLGRVRGQSKGIDPAPSFVVHNHAIRHAIPERRNLDDMLDLKTIRSHPEKVREALDHRGTDLDLSAFERMDEERRTLLKSLEELRHQRNTVSDAIASRKRNGEDASDMIADMKTVSSEIKEQETRLAGIQEGLEPFLLEIPNIPHESVPVGRDESDNALVRSWGTVPEFDFQPLAHWDIGERLGILDFPRAAKIAGARFRPVSRRWSPPGAGPDQLHAGRPHGGARVYGDPPALHGQCGQHDRHGPAPQVRGRSFQDPGVEPLSDSNGRGPGDEHSQGGGPEGGRPAPLLHGLHPLLPVRGRLPWKGHEGSDQAAPVQQGGAGEVTQGRRTPGTSWSA